MSFQKRRLAFKSFDDAGSRIKATQGEADKICRYLILHRDAFAVCYADGVYIFTLASGFDMNRLKSWRWSLVKPGEI